MTTNEEPRHGVSRRRFITRSAATIGGIALAPSVLGGASAWASSPAALDAARIGGKLDVLNWPLYLDKKSKKAFPRATGIKLNYNEGLNDNNEFFAKYQEQFSRGQDIGFDIVVPTSWLANRLMKLGYLQKLPLDLAANVANLDPAFHHPTWDPTGEFTIPWQTGMTGIAYNIDVTGRELHSTDDLFDPKFKGKIGMLLEMRDTVGLVLQADGVDPTTVTYKQAGPAFKRLEKAVNSGQVRRFTGNDYQDDLVAGNFAACVSWSGDVAQLTLDNPKLRFVIPQEGGNRWADTMCMVKTSKRRKQVGAWIDYFYDPVNAARVAAFVQYISPVANIKPELAKLDPAAPTNPLIFPPADVQAQLKIFRTLGKKEEEKFDTRFAQITGGG